MTDTAHTGGNHNCMLKQSSGDVKNDKCSHTNNPVCIPKWNYDPTTDENCPEHLETCNLLAEMGDLDVEVGKSSRPGFDLLPFPT